MINYTISPTAPAGNYRTGA